MSRQNENDIEHDVDMSEIIDRLYAEVHYAIGDESVDANATKGEKSSKTTAENDNESNRIVSPYSVIHSTGNLPRNSNRYWASNDDKQTTSSRANYNKKYTGAYNSRNTKLVSPANEKSEKSNPNPIVPSGSKPKAFTPYKSLMTDTVVQPNNDTDNDATVHQSNNQNAETSSSLTQTSKLLKSKSASNEKRDKRDKRKNPFSDKLIETSGEKRLNPFCKLKDPHTRREAKEKMNEKKKRADQAREKSKQSKNPTDHVVFEENVAELVDVHDGESDDDVIILPTPPVPMICIDSSEDENSNDSNAKGDPHQFTQPQKSKKKSKQSKNEQPQPSGSRCSSPTSSIQSNDDFIVQNDRNRSNASNCIREEDLIEVSQTVEHILQRSGNQALDAPDPPHPTDAEIFARPNDSDVENLAKQKKNKKKGKENAKKTYCVDEKSFAAIDVYESESSDMPETVYRKGLAMKRKKEKESPSSDSSIESVDLQKAKRLRKRKSSGSQKESDHVSSQSSLSDDDDERNENDLPYLVRGEALGSSKVRKSQSKKAKKSRKHTLSCSEHASDNEFITKLTSIVHGDSDDGDENIDESIESIAARDIVQTVLQKRSKRSKRSKNVNDDTEAATIDCDVDENRPSQEVRLVQALEQNLYESDVAEAERSVESTGVVNVPSEESTLDAERPEFGWNEEMDYFYNKKWSGHKFSVNKIMSKMPQDRSKWIIAPEDRNPRPRSTRTHLRCTNCQEVGHKMSRCRYPKKENVCYMCGRKGHSEPRCPNTICLKCGQKTKVFKFGCDNCRDDINTQCFVCRRVGHKAMECPDKWRRYHSTVKYGVELTQFQRDKVRNKRNYCSVCAQEGHLAENCRHATRILMRPVHSVFVKSYRDSYKVLPEDPADTEDPAKYVILSSTAGNSVVNYGKEVRTNDKTRIYGRFCVESKFKPPVFGQLDIQKAKDHVKSASKIATIPQVEMYEESSSENNRVVQEVNHDSVIENQSTKKHVNPTATASPTIPEAPPAPQHIFFAEENSKSTENDCDNSQEQLIDDPMNESIAIDPGTCSARSENSISTTTIEKIIEYKKLENSIETLEKIREDLVTNSQLNSTETEATEVEESESADFIPIDPMHPEIEYGTSEVVPTTTDPSEAKIMISADHCKYLMTNRGHSFLREQEEKHKISLNLEWTYYGNVMNITGCLLDQVRFRRDLFKFFQEIDSKVKANETSLPRNKDKLKNIIRTSVKALSTLSLNVEEYFRMLRRDEREKSKRGMKRAEEARRLLNMSLFGAYGFEDGTEQMKKLEFAYRSLLDMTKDIVSFDFRRRISEHMAYIFSGNNHGNYLELIEKYRELKKAKQLPETRINYQLFQLTKPKSTKSNETSFKQVFDDAKLVAKLNKGSLPNESNVQLNISTDAIQTTSNTTKTEDSAPDPNNRRICSRKCKEMIAKTLNGSHSKACRLYMMDFLCQADELACTAETVRKLTEYIRIGAHKCLK